MRRSIRSWFLVQILISLVVFSLPALFLGPGQGLTQELGAIKLPPPVTQGGKPLMQALKERHSDREFSPEKLPLQTLSNLLWAADGMNRPGKRTAPSARNWQEIDIYVALPEGLYLYDAGSSTLKPVLAKDIRALTGLQSYVAGASLNLVYVADFRRVTGPGTAEAGTEKMLYSAADTGFISQNVYLFCASEGLATVVRGMVDRPALAKAMKLSPEQTIILTQSVGFPKKK